VQIAMSDGTAPAGYSGLVGHSVAVIIFAVVVNRQADVYNLTTAQLRAIFQGSITNWRQAGGASLPISIVAPVEYVGHPAHVRLDGPRRCHRAAGVLV
jgi:ABC-type phosphate transport system substrate-binding protein